MPSTRRATRLPDDARDRLAKARVAFFGTGEFAVPLLEMLVDAGVRPVCVVTTPDTKVGREQILTPPPVKIAAERLLTPVAFPGGEHQAPKPVPMLQPEKLDDNFRKTFAHHKPDIAVLADYGKLVPQAVLDTPKYGFVNAHPSLLPRYRGASPVEAAILNGDTETGVTLMHVDAKLDHGPIFARRRVRLRMQETGASLRARLARLSALLMARVLPRILEGTVKFVPQHDEQATFARALSREDGKISFAEDAITLERKVRAFTPWPGTYTIWRMQDAERRFKIIEAGIAPLPDDLAESPYGTVVKLPTGEVGAITPSGVLTFRTVQLEGKSPAPIAAFLNGYPALIGSVLA